MAAASPRPASPGMIALFGVAGAMLLGAAIAQTTPTGMLERTADDWRSRLPQTYSGLTYTAVGSAPESLELGRRPLDPALLAGQEMVLDYGRVREPLYAAATYAPEREPAEYAPLPSQAPESAAVVTVHRGTQSAKAAAEPVTAEPVDEVSAQPVEVAAATPPEG